MTHPENGKPLWTEAQVETLLEEFFEQEMPPDLRSDPPGLPPRHPARSFPASLRLHSGQKTSSSAIQKRSRSQPGIVAVGFSAVLMVMVALLAWDRPDSSLSTKNTKPRPEGSAVSEDDASPVNDSANPLDREGRGPVEMRPGVHHVGEGDPGGPSQFPELDIEVFPLEPGPARGKKAPKPSLPESQPPQSEPTPMPEENRPLPENQPPQSADPDEAASEPVLPELQSSPIPASDI